jgi:hypothetical protein
LRGRTLKNIKFQAPNAKFQTREENSKLKTLNAKQIQNSKDREVF